MVENTLSKKIDTAGQNASYDAYCRNLLVTRQILARILKTCVKEFHDCPIKDIEEKYLDEKPKVHEVAVHRDESAEFIDGIGKEDVEMKEKPISIGRFRLVGCEYWGYCSYAGFAAYPTV